MFDFELLCTLFELEEDQNSLVSKAGTVLLS